MGQIDDTFKIRLNTLKKKGNHHIISWYKYFLPCLFWQWIDLHVTQSTIVHLSDSKVKKFQKYHSPFQTDVYLKCSKTSGFTLR